MGGSSLVEWIVDLAAPNPHSEKPQIDFQEAYNASIRDEYLKQLSTTSRKQKWTNSTDLRKPGLLHSTFTILKYRGVASYSKPEFLGPRIGEKMFLSIMLSLIYFGIGDGHGTDDIQSTVGGLYFTIAMCGYGAGAFMPSLTMDRAIFYRELSDGYYSATAYFFSKFIQEAIIAAFTSLLFSAVVFNCMSLQGNFGIFVLTYYLTSMIGIVVAYVVASLVSDLGAANALLPTYVTICMCFGGLFILLDTLPVYVAWFGYTTFLRYGFNALMLNQFSGETNGDRAVYDGETVLDFYGMQSDFTGEIWICLAMLCIILVFWGSVGLTLINKVNHSSR